MWLRSSRFSQRSSSPSPQLAVSPFRSFRLSPKQRLDCHLDHTVIPSSPSPWRNSLGVFLDAPLLPSLFCSDGFKGFPLPCGRSRSLASGTRPANPIPRTPLKTGYAAPNTDVRISSKGVSRAGSIPSRRNAESLFPRKWVSVEGGSTPACPCRSPSHLNPQQQPPTGRQKPPPRTSSMCQQRIFRPVFKNKAGD